MKSVTEPDIEATDTANAHSNNGHANGYHGTNTAPETLSSAHQKLLEDSAIAPEIAAACGFSTIPATDQGRARLRELGFGKNQILTPALHIPAHDVFGSVRPGQIRPDIPRIDGRKEKAIKYETPAGSSAIVDVPPMAREYINDPGVDLWITEGKRKAASGISNGLKCIISIAGVFSFRGKNEYGGTTALPDWEMIALNGRKVYLVFDSDVTRKPEVQRALARLKAFLESRGAHVFIVYLPDGANGKKTGLDDFFVRGGTLEVLYTHVSDALRSTDKAQARAEKNRLTIEALRATGLPVIETNNRQQSDELHDLSEAIARYNAASPSLFHGAGGLVRIEMAPNGLPQLKAATRETVQDIAGVAARWISTSEHEGIREVAPPREKCAIYRDNSRNWRGVPTIESTATAPFFAPDGTLCATTGYHASARTWLSLPAGFALSDTTPTPANVEAAKVLLLDTLLGEVSFADNAARAHAVAQMILPFVRRLIDGATPLHLWDAPLRGAGKSYAAEVCILPFAEPAATPEKASAEEWRKSLLCDLITGPSHIFFDNIKGSLHSPALDAAITSSYFKDRLTGTGEMVTAPVRCVWVATANNAELTEDAVTRAVVIRLDPESENPDCRAYERDPKAFIRQNRGQVCGAVITLVRAWMEAGRPDYSGPHRCRFPQWQNVIGGILQNASIPGFLENLEAQREAIGGTISDDWAEMVALWHEAHGDKFVTAQQLLPLAEKVLGIAAQLEKSEGAQRSRKLMSLLRHRRDRIFGGFKIICGPKIERQSSYRLAPKKEVIDL